ncbi:hypothetical protein C1645_768563 [Glomus cerebriforme]|uniref:Uncharacterized protein n=1 Tax=Glomus cerebriforme TaxID=658196 RepID=A0A397T784_9GLOM|nr:hypothetical protein C1645_768563 [Glomus cerebriforme]
MGNAWRTLKRLVKFVKECKEVKELKKKAFSSYCSLKEVLAKYGITNGVKDIPQFLPETHKINDNDTELQQCLTEIKRRLRTMGTVVPDSNEAMRCEFISAILHSAILYVKEITKKNITLDLQFEVVGEENTGRVDYTIRLFDNSQEYEIICITGEKQHQVAIGFAQNLTQCESACQTNKKKRKVSEAFESDYLYGIVTTGVDWYFILYTTEGIYCTSKTEYHISLTESVLDNDTELCTNLKRLMEVIVGLLKDKVDVNESPSKKKKCLQ